MTALRSRNAFVVAGWSSLLLAGCAAGDSPDRPKTLLVMETIHHVDEQNREPMLAEVPGVGLFVTGYPRLPHEPPRAPSLWTSADAGQTWRRVNVGTPGQGAMGNSDTDLAVGPDGTLYFVSMGFDRTNSEGTHITVGVSRDGGSTWSWTMLSQSRLVDRPWVDVSDDGTAHVIWNDGAGVLHTTSSDGGRSWAEPSRIHPAGGSSHLALGPGGLVAVRITSPSASGNQFDDGVDLIAVSGDAGRSWQTHPAPGHRIWEQVSSEGSIPRWVEPVAWDANGDLYHLWSEGREMMLGRSVDGGATWEFWTIARSDGIVFFPYLVAGARRELAATWFSEADGTSVRAAIILVPASGADGAPRVVLSSPLALESWAGSGPDRTRDPAGEYVPVAFLADGDLGVVTPLQDPETDRMGFTFWRLELR